MLSLRRVWPAPSLGSGGIVAETDSAVAVDRHDRNGERRKHRLVDALDLTDIDLNAIDPVLALSENILAKAKEPRRASAHQGAQPARTDRKGRFRALGII